MMKEANERYPVKIYGYCPIPFVGPALSPPPVLEEAFEDAVNKKLGVGQGGWQSDMS